MARLKLLPLCLSLALVAPGAGLADPWKNESGQGRGRGDRGGDHRGERLDDRRDDRRSREYRDRSDRRDGYGGERRDDRRGYYPPPYAQPRIPSGHRPPPGEYRRWFPDRPPGHQPPPQRW